MSSSTSRSSTAWIPRVLGIATAAYSVAIIAKPELFARPTKLANSREEIPRGTTIGIRALGGRDLASGMAMALAPAGTPLRTAVAVRVGSDVVDLALLGTSLPDRDARTKAVAVAGGWGALCALGLWAA